MTGLYETLSDVAAEVAAMSQRDRRATVAHFASELRGFLDDAGASVQERRDLAVRLMDELTREVTQ